jgi:hypothetical protein
LSSVIPEEKYAQKSVKSFKFFATVVSFLKFRAASGVWRDYSLDICVSKTNLARVPSFLRRTFNMPYTITVKNKVVHCALTGHITLQDLVALQGESKNYEQNVDVVPHRITDLTGVEELALHYPDISGLAERRAQAHFPNTVKSAIIAQDKLHLGYARMYQTLNRNPQMLIEVFPDEASALKWIASSSW